MQIKINKIKKTIMLKFLSKLMNKNMEEDKKEITEEIVKNDSSKEISKEEVIEETPKEPKITYDDFKKVQIKVGEIMAAEKVENADKLLRLQVSFGDEQRQIVSGISEYYPDPTNLIGKKVPFVTNLESRTIRGVESDGMIMAAIDRDNNKFSLLDIDLEIPSGTNIS